MKTYYCHNCGLQHGYFDNVAHGKLLGTVKQREKFEKHTSPSTEFRIASIFNDSSTQAFEDYVVNTLASGCVEIDERRRRNIIWIAGKPTGALYRYGKFELPENSVKVVLSTDPQRIHAYPISSTTMSTGVCADCGGSILT